jgi:Xaa-Pro aminopeptidase
MTRQKTAEEVAAMEETQRATEAAMTAVIEYLRGSPTPTSEEAHAIIDRILTEHDCESPKGHIVAGGLQPCEPHESGTGPIEKGTAIVVDIFPRSKKTGYFADMTRTVCIGEPPEKLQKMYDTVLAAHELALSMVKPGAACKDIHNAATKFFVDQGYQTSGKGTLFTYAEGFVHALGHGVGQEVHEKPTLNPKSEDLLTEGDVITIEPGLYYKSIGGIRIEDMVLVTEDGCRNLSSFSKEFVIR